MRISGISGISHAFGGSKPPQGAQREESNRSNAHLQFPSREGLGVGSVSASRNPHRAQEIVRGIFRWSLKPKLKQPQKGTRRTNAILPFGLDRFCFFTRRSTSCGWILCLKSSVLCRVYYTHESSRTYNNDLEDAPLRSTATSRLRKARTSPRTPKPVVAAPAASGFFAANPAS